MQPTQALYQLRWLTRVLAIVILMVVGVGFFLPTQYAINRSVVIKASPDEVMAYLLQAPSWAEWMHVENGKLEINDNALSVGSVMTLKYPDELQNGRVEIERIEDTGVSFQVTPKAHQMPVANQLSIEIVNNATQITWIVRGDLDTGLLSPYIAMFANDIAGGNLELGLQRIADHF